MARRPSEFPVILKVEYVPVSAERAGVYRAGLLLLLQMIYDERRKYNAEVEDENIRISLDRDDKSVRPALLSVEGIAEGKTTSTSSRLHAWVIGHHGSVQRIPLAEWRT